MAVNIHEALADHSAQYAKRLERLGIVADRVAGLIVSPTTFNGEAHRRGRNELCFLVGVAQPLQRRVPSQLSRTRLGDFARGFVMDTGYDDKKEAPIPITFGELMQISAASYHPEDYSTCADHRARPAFHRALMLARPLLTELAANMSERGRDPIAYAPEIFLAYQIMSRLVSEQDPGAINADGRINSSYMYSREVPRPHQFPVTALASA